MLSSFQSVFQSTKIHLENDKLPEETPSLVVLDSLYLNVLTQDDSAQEKQCTTILLLWLEVKFSKP